MTTNKFQGLINTANTILSTKITTDAQLDTWVANATPQGYNQLITGLSQMIDKEVTDTLNVGTGIVNTFTKSIGKVTSSVVTVMEVNLGEHADYNVKDRILPNDTDSSVLEFTYTTAYKKRFTLTLAQAAYKEAFSNGQAFGSWLAQLIQRALIDTPTRWENQVIGAKIVDQFKNEKSISLSKALDVNDTDLMAEAVYKIANLLAGGVTPSCLFEIGYTDAALKAQNAFYDADTDTYQSGFDKTKHMTNTFVGKNLVMLCSPVMKLALDRAIANVYHGDPAAIEKFITPVSCYKVADDELLIVDTATIGVQRVLNTTGVDTFGASLKVDQHKHMWYNFYVKPYGIGFKVNVTNA